MATLIGIVYSAKGLILRRVIQPDFDSQLDDPAWVQPGETMLRIPIADEVLTRGLSWEGIVEAKIGQALNSPRCAVVDPQGTVVNVICADPDLDSVPGHTLVLSLTHSIGETIA